MSEPSLLPPNRTGGGSQATYAQVEDSLLKRRTRTYTRKYQPAHSFSLYGAPPPPPAIDFRGVTRPALENDVALFAGSGVQSLICNSAFTAFTHTVAISAGAIQSSNLGLAPPRLRSNRRSSGTQAVVYKNGLKSFFFCKCSFTFGLFLSHSGCVWGSDPPPPGFPFKHTLPPHHPRAPKCL